MKYLFYKIWRNKVLIKLFGRGELFRLLFNLSPMYKNTGGKLIRVSDDLHYIKVQLLFNYKTRNYVGTIYGGHMYSSIDGIYVIQLIHILGDNYIVWDKSAKIKFKRPASKTLFADFKITPELVAQIKIDLQKEKKKDYNFFINLTDLNGDVYAEVEKVIYIASKEYYKAKKINSAIMKFNK